MARSDTRDANRIRQSRRTQNLPLSMKWRTTYSTPPQALRSISRFSISAPLVAVGTIFSSRPPHRSQRAGLPHWAPTLGCNAQSLSGI